MRREKASSRPRLLVLDDDDVSCTLISEIGQHVGYEVLSLVRPDQFRTTYMAFHPAVIVLDLVLPETDGVELLRFLADNDFGGDLVLVTGMDAKVLATARRLAVSRGLSLAGAHNKPLKFQALDATLRDCLPNGVLEEQLRQAIENQDLGVEYQPQVVLEEAASPIRSCEALLRWRPTGQAHVPPEQVLALAEEANLTDELTFEVLRKSFENIKAWDEQGLSLSVAVNLPAQLLEDLTLPDRISVLLADFGLDPNRVMIEVTESDVMAKPERSLDILTRLRLKGMGLSIDDFGTGYSSLVQLHHLPFNELKVDRSLLSEVPENEDARTILRTIIDLAHGLGMSVCAEGAERPETLDHLRTLGCDVVQGFVIQGALPPEALSAFVHDWNATGHSSTTAAI